MNRKLLKTLSYQIDKEIKESLYQNKVFLKSRWSFLEKSIVLWSTHYKKYTSLVFFLFLLVFVNLVIWQPLVKDLLFEYLSRWRELLNWQSGFLTGQLTIVGVVYPLVVGLISVLFQNKSAKKTIFPIYQKYSGFMFSGLSGLALSIFIVIGYFLRASLDDQQYLAFCISSAIWLSLNILLTAWFFVQTFRMLDDTSRDRLILRFSIHESCEFDIRERIKQILIQDAIRYKLLINPNESILKVKTYKFSDNDYDEVTRTVASDSSISNIHYWLINVAIILQIKILSFHKSKDATLVIQPLTSIRNGSEMIVAKYNNFKINPLVKILIKAAYSFKRKEFKSGVGLTTILNGFVGPANDALREGSTKDFSDAINNISDWHAEIAQALSFKNNEGDQDNWLLLKNSNLFGRSYLDELLSEYYSLARNCVEKIPDNSRFYNDMLYLHERIFSGGDELGKQEIRLLIQGSYYMWYLLIEWRSYSSESGDLRISNKYEDILYDFVGAWENWIMLIEPRSKRTGDIERSYPAFITHLEYTASTAISALRFNNYEAAGWGVDMLNKWLENLSRDEYWNEEFTWRSILLNHLFLLKDSEDPSWQAILKGNEYNYLAAFGISFNNASLDLRIITACYMLLKPGKNQHELLINYVKSLLSGKNIHDTGSVGGSSQNISNAGELLGAYIRHRDYRYYGNDSYGTWLSSILDSFGRIYEERRVSGRIYSGWGANDPKSMDKAYVEIALSLSEKTWKLPNDWEEAILSEAFRHMDRTSIVTDLRDWLKIAKEERTYIIFDDENKEIFITNFCDSIEKIINRIEKAQVDDVCNADIDLDRLRQYGLASSAIFNEIESPAFPLNLFGNIDYVTDLDTHFLYEMNVSNYEKARVAVGVDTNRAINEEEWLANIITNNVKINVLRKLIKYPVSDFYKYKSIDSMLLDIREKLKSLTSPILFVGSHTVRNLLRRSSLDRNIASSYDISRSDGFGNAYLCHIGSCQVYKLPFNDVDFCLLTTKELYRKISFRQINIQQFVEVDFIPDDENVSIGDLNFNYWMDVELLIDAPCIKFELDIN